MAKYKSHPTNPGALIALDDEAEQVLARIEAGESSRHAVRESLNESDQIRLERAFQIGLTPEAAKIAAEKIIEGRDLSEPGDQEELGQRKHSGDNDNLPLGPGWVKVPMHYPQMSLEKAFQSLGLTPEQAKIAADLKPKHSGGFAL